MKSATTIGKNPTSLLGLSLALFLGFALLAPGASFGATQETATRFTRTIDDWTATLNRIEKGFNNSERTTGQANELRATLQALRNDANLARDRAIEHIDETETLLTALGPKPEEGSTAEPRDVAEKRTTYEERLADFKGRAAQAQLIVRRIDATLLALSKIEQEEILKELLEHQSVPISPTNLAEAPAAFAAYLARVKATTVTGLLGAQTRTGPVNPDGPQGEGRDEGRDEAQAEGQGTGEEAAPMSDTLPKGLIVVILILILSASAFASRRLLINKLGRDPAIAAPSYTRRLIAASVEPLANGLLPASLAFALWYGLNWAFTLSEGDFLAVIEGSLTALLLIIASYALPHAALSPDKPNWRVAPIKEKNARYITKRIGALGFLFGLDVFVSYTLSDADTAWITIYAAVNATLEAILVLDLLRPALWQPDPHWYETEATDLAPPAPAQGTMGREHLAVARWLQALRLLVALIAISSVIAGWSGYTTLSAYLMGGLLGSATIVGGLFLLRALLTEWINLMMHRRNVIDGLNLSDTGIETVSFWLIGFMKVVIYIAGALIVSQIWGLQLGEAGTLLYNIMTGIQVGGATISVTDITTAILVLIVGLALIRAIKRLLVSTILPQTRLDPGAQYSIAAVFGYVGIVATLITAAAALGMDFQNLIIIAGALSVGIGFGLQNIANNFVSGLILLFERPVRVGDLIEINGTLGHVTHINVRRTEIETFQKSEVMIPNSELISTAFTNWTHTDRKGRIEINVGVAYGSDTSLVRKTLLQAVENVDKILTWPPADVLFLDFGDSSLNFQLRCFTSDVTSRITTASNLRFEIDRLFRQNHIEIPFPQRVVHMAEPKAGTAPEATPAPSTEGNTGPAPTDRT